MFVIKKIAHAMCSVMVCLLLAGFLVGCNTGFPPSGLLGDATSGTGLFVGDATALTPSVDSAGHLNQIILERQPDCSITEDLLTNPFLTLTSSVAASVPNFQNTLHSRARLTTTPNQFLKGCKNATQGIASTTAIYLGRTKSGQFIGAGLDFSNALHIGTLDLGTGAISQSGAKVTSVPNPTSLATADLNGDGNNDLIVVDSANTTTGDLGGIYIFLGNGDGTFQTPVVYPAGIAPFAVTIDDVNHDGKLDLIVAGFQFSQFPALPPITNGVTVLLGNGDGTFGLPVSSPSRGSMSIASGDFNGDGNTDVVLGNGDILLGKGDGTFAATVFSLPLPLGDFGGVPVVGDFNNDGKLDVAISDVSAPDGIHIFVGKGDGTFTAESTYVKPRQTPDVAAADLDGDGNLDLVAGLGNLGLFGPDINGTGGVYAVLMGNGDGTFQGAPLYAAAAAPNTMTTISAASSGSPAFAVGDFNGDGKLDILGASLTSTGGSQPFSNGLQLLTGDGKGNFTPGPPIPGSTPSIITAADMNGDKKLDAVFVDGPNFAAFASSIGVAFGNGDGTFQAVTDYTVPGTGSVQDMVLGDFNGDGKLDVLVTTAGATSGPFSSTYLFLNNGDGTLGTAKLVDTPISGFALAVADLNGDGKLDFVETNTDNDLNGTPGSLLVYLGNGDGTFAPPVAYPLPQIAPGPVAIADMNNDGKPDIVVASRDQAFTTATLSIFPGKGDGTFGNPINTALPDTAFSSLAVADFDGDGNQDVVVGECCGEAFTLIFLGNGDGTIKSQTQLPLGSSSLSVAAVDVNGDKHPDLLLVSGNAIDVFLNLASSGSTTGSATSTSLSVTPNPAASGQPVTFTSQVSSSASGTPTGTVTFFDGTTTLGTGTLSANTATFTTSSLAAGSHSITAVYAGDTNFTGSTSAAVNIGVTVPIITSTTTLTANPTSAVSGTSVAFTAQVSAATGTAIPSGTVTFTDGTTSLGGVALDATGKAVFTTAALSVGTHTIRASYAGATGFAASTSSNLSITIAAPPLPDFTTAVSPASSTVTHGSSTMTTLSITPINGFNAATALTCSGAPSGSTCTIAPTSVTPNGTAAATAVVTLQTPVQTGLLRNTQRDFTLFAMLPFGFFGTTLLAFKCRRRRPLLLSALMVVTALVAMSGCGGSSPAFVPFTETITLNGTSGALSHSATWTVSVQ
ncbi:MAG: FG-GAP-like repeat-containing protein [Acidobacteriaceae bacterium]